MAKRGRQGLGWTTDRHRQRRDELRDSARAFLRDLAEAPTCESKLRTANDAVEAAAMAMENHRAMAGKVSDDGTYRVYRQASDAFADTLQQCAIGAGTLRAQGKYLEIDGPAHHRR